MSTNGSKALNEIKINFPFQLSDFFPKPTLLPLHLVSLYTYALYHFRSHTYISANNPQASPFSVPFLNRPSGSFSPLFLSFPLSLCVLDHFLSFQVSGPVEAEYSSSPCGCSAPYSLTIVSFSLCSLYPSVHTHVGGWGWGTGWSPAYLLQQQTLNTHSLTHTHSRAHTTTITYLYSESSWLKWERMRDVEDKSKLKGRDAFLGP